MFSAPASVLSRCQLFLIPDPFKCYFMLHRNHSITCVAMHTLHRGEECVMSTSGSDCRFELSIAFSGTQIHGDIQNIICVSKHV